MIQTNMSVGFTTMDEIALRPDQNVVNNDSLKTYLRLANPLFLMTLSRQKKRFVFNRDITCIILKWKFYILSKRGSKKYGKLCVYYQEKWQFDTWFPMLYFYFTHLNHFIFHSFRVIQNSMSKYGKDYIQIVHPLKYSWWDFRLCHIQGISPFNLYLTHSFYLN